MYKPEELTDMDGLTKERQGMAENTDVQRGPQCHSQLSMPRQFLHISNHSMHLFSRGCIIPAPQGLPCCPPGLGLPDHARSIILARLQMWEPRAVGQSKFIQREGVLAKLLFFFFLFNSF